MKPRQRPRAKRPAYILRIEIPGFYASAWDATKPVVVIRDRMVLDVNDLARGCGVTPGLSRRNATNLMPHGILRQWQEDDYAERRRQWLDACVPYTDVIEPVDGHIAYLDLSAHPAPHEIAEEAIHAVERALGLTVRIGVGPAKWLATLAAQRGNDGWALWDPREFLAPLPVDLLLPASEAARERLRFLGYRTIGKVAALDLGTLRTQFGEEGMTIHLAARGMLTEPVAAIYPPNAMSDRVVFADPVDSLTILEANLETLARSLGDRLRQRGLEGLHLDLRIETEAGGWRTASREFAKPMRDPRTLGAAARVLWGAQPPKEPITGLGLGLRDLRRVTAFQVALVGRNTANDRAILLDRAVDHVRATFGGHAVRRASELPVLRRIRVLREWQNALGWR